jgi:hypothetical protein
MFNKTLFIKRRESIGILKKVSASALVFSLVIGSATTTLGVSDASSKPSVTRGEYVKEFIYLFRC